MTGEPLEDVEVRWEYPDITIAPSRTNTDGQAQVQFSLPGVRKGVLYAIVMGGYAGWEVAALSFELLPNDMTWLQEFRPSVNGRSVEWRSEEHTSELQSLMRISYAVFCLKKKKD